MLSEMGSERPIPQTLIKVLNSGKIEETTLELKTQEVRSKAQEIISTFGKKEEEEFPFQFERKIADVLLNYKITTYPKTVQIDIPYGDSPKSIRLSESINSKSKNQLQKEIIDGDTKPLTVEKDIFLTTGSAHLILFKIEDGIVYISGGRKANVDEVAAFSEILDYLHSMLF
jgi:hypothetical protein